MAAFTSIVKLGFETLLTALHCHSIGGKKKEEKKKKKKIKVDHAIPPLLPAHTPLPRLKKKEKKKKKKKRKKKSR